jgi:hypothetical protein
MKIKLTPDEIKAGFRQACMSKKRVDVLTFEKATLPLFFLSGRAKIDGVRYVAVLCTDIAGAVDGQTRISFEPVSAQAFMVFNKETKAINQVTLLMPSGQFTFTETETRRTSYSMDGPGVDPELIRKSWNGLAVAFGDDKNSDICSRIIAHLRETLIQAKKAA